MAVSSKLFGKIPAQSGTSSKPILVNVKSSSKGCFDVETKIGNRYYRVKASREMLSGKRKLQCTGKMCKWQGILRPKDIRGKVRYRIEGNKRTPGHTCIPFASDIADGKEEINEEFNNYKQDQTETFAFFRTKIARARAIVRNELATNTTGFKE